MYIMYELFVLNVRVDGDRKGGEITAIEVGWFERWNRKTKIEHNEVHFESLGLSWDMVRENRLSVIII